MDFNKYFDGEAFVLDDCTSINISELVRFLQSNTHITKLFFGDNKIDDEGAKALAKLPNLTSLNLYYNKIGDEGAKALAQSKTLINLNLGHNKISDEGAKALAQSKTLTDLNLIQNNIGVEGIEALAKLQHCEVVLLGGQEIFYNFLSGVYSNKHTMNEESLKKVVLK